MFASIISQPAEKPTIRSVLFASLMATTIIVGLSTAAHAQTPAAPAPTPAVAAASPAMPAQTKSESVEDRISSLHASLKITPAEEADWTGVAQVMRSNAAAMDKLMTEKSAKDPSTLTAVDDLKNYEHFAQAHVTGLKKLIPAFDKLYATMPAAQKKIADEVFLNSRHPPAASNG